MIEEEFRSQNGLRPAALTGVRINMLLRYAMRSLLINKIRTINKFLGVSVLLSDIGFILFISRIVTENFWKNYSTK
ncbi:hypothetical protein A6769_07010 [Nostoc punctiforme NIES-2108]|uniref:Uncharacterized protein n=1 Tax=Nostoc punctiforme NIES-2108 TaxID=1356359 RepID=A0A367RV02_NOSPU|nr:hypothetical protein A6769_07010 [Nostoc punctiforme NIES-2108]